ncbi:polysaccharide deacetylase family protein [Defluviimonas salinarum]|uniref:Chitooligosaccharide deacetylase n=1 Tax=Defluviimonas salinarum TaxID=2992147 RepID=A0ABT3J5Z3_9RHOB|nr:polysaccharide deacetylase family protein [Defluviimonas salinarum]MCW3783072.1 polysaccharide deacetylase family protein [Defluviimonas salinarum]
MPEPVIDILMYHSISDRSGPTCIPPEVFAGQMRVLAESGLPVISLDDLVASRDASVRLAPHAVIVTFDDGFQDFADAAWPVMEPLGIRPIVYLPTGHIGGAEGWRGGTEPPRPLMGWGTIRALAREGVAFGSHTVTHADLDALTGDMLEAELRRSQQEIADQLDRPVHHFAPPYGIAGDPVRRRVAAYYQTSVGTRLGQADAGSDLHDLPRLEMFYFTDLGHWRRHLDGRGATYLARRKAMRAVRGAVMKPWQGV